MTSRGPFWPKTFYDSMILWCKKPIFKIRTYTTFFIEFPIQIKADIKKKQNPTTNKTKKNNPAKNTQVFIFSWETLFFTEICHRWERWLLCVVGHVLTWFSPGRTMHTFLLVLCSLKLRGMLKQLTRSTISLQQWPPAKDNHKISHSLTGQP